MRVLHGEWTGMISVTVWFLDHHCITMNQTHSISHGTAAAAAACGDGVEW